MVEFLYFASVSQVLSRFLELHDRLVEFSLEVEHLFRSGEVDNAEGEDDFALFVDDN